MKDKGKIVIKLNESENMAFAICVWGNTKHVASDPKFIPFVSSLIDTAIERKTEALEDLEKATLLDSKHSVQEAIQILIAEGIGSVKISSIQPKIFLDDMYVLKKSTSSKDESAFGIFTHNHIGAIVEISGTDKEVAKNMAIQIVSILPDKRYNDNNIKTLRFRNLLDQPYFKVPEITVGAMLDKSNCSILQFTRLEMGADVIGFNANQNYQEPIFQSAIIIDSISPADRSQSDFDVNEIFNKITKLQPYSKDKILSILANYNISHTEQDGESLLSLAVSNQNYNLTKTLLEAGANVNNLNPESIPEEEWNGDYENDYDYDYDDEEDEDEIYYKNPLHLAIESNNHEMVKLLLSFSANTYDPIDQNNNCITAACKMGNMEIILSLMKAKAELDMQTKSEMHEKYDSNHAQRLPSEVENLDADIQNSILDKFHKSEYLKKHSDLPKIVKAIRFIDFAVDLTGGNADDKIEVMIIEFDDSSNKTYRLEYTHMFNWSYGDNIVKLKLFDGQGQSTIINHEGDHNVSEDAFALDKLMGLAKKLNVSYLDIREFCYFLVILLSRMIQKDDFTDDENILDEVLERHIFIWPVQDICKKAGIDFSKTAINHIKNEWVDDRK